MKKRDEEKAAAIERMIESEPMTKVIRALDTRDWLTDEEVDIVMDAVLKEEAPRLICRRCKYEWMPDVRKWRDRPDEKFLTFKGEDVRLLICPACSAKNYVPIGEALHILKWWTDFKKLTEEVKREQREARAINYQVDDSNG